PTAAAMRDLRLAADYGMSITPTLAGFLLFGRSGPVEQLIPQSQVALVRFSGTGMHSPIIERADFTGNVTSLFDRALLFPKRCVVPWETPPPRTVIQSGNGSAEPVRARSNYPRDAVIEALTNLLAHRDYSVAGLLARILIFDDRIEFINPSRANGATKRSV